MKFYCPIQNTFALLFLLKGASSIELNVSSIDSITSVSQTIAYDLMSIYNGNSSGGIPGMLPYPPYHWWESGGMWASMIDYWSYTNDSTYNDLIEEGMLFQVGPNWDFLPPNQTLGMGNDDQGFWGMAAMTAAELKFQDPPASGPQWLGLAQAVFNQFVARNAIEVETYTCNGGLRWQVYFWEEGWTYKNTISNACFFNLGARLARYTKNDTYAQIAETSWDWMVDHTLIQLQPYSNASANFSYDGKGAGGYVAWDGTTVGGNCTGYNGIPYTYNAGILLHGAATMYNHTGSPIWANRTQLLLNGTLNAFFRDGIAVEVACEGRTDDLACDTDMLSFKAYLTRSMAATTQLAPFTSTSIMAVFKTSAEAAALQCSGGRNGRMCGLQWAKRGEWDGSQGAGQQMAALEIVMSNMIGLVKAPVTVETGGTSIGDPSAGTRPPISKIEAVFVAREGDKIAAGFVTMFSISGMMALFVWICRKEVESENN